MERLKKTYRIIKKSILSFSFAYVLLSILGLSPFFYKLYPFNLFPSHILFFVSTIACVILVYILAYKQQEHDNVSKEYSRIEFADSHFQKAQELAKIGSWVNYLDENKVIISDEFYKIFEIESEAQKRDVFDARLHPEDKEFVIALMNQTICSNAPFEVTHRIVTPSGIKWVKAKGDVVVKNKSRIFTGIIQDITKERTAEEQLKKMIEERDSFLSVCSHEIKTPLTSLKLTSQMTQRNLKKNGVVDNAKLDRFLKTADTQLDKLNSLVNDMLDVGRIRTGKFSFKMEKANLSILVLESIKKAELSLPSDSPIGITFNGPENIKGEFDKTRIEQVVLNLLTNAIRYGLNKPISVNLSLEGGTAFVRVQDQGRGVSDDDKARIFECFERGEEASSINGLGVGLFISKQIILAHGGEIDVKSEGTELGSTFYFSIPNCYSEKTSENIA